ncbi:LytTR family DNA-binding domain-containing protein [Anaerolentibacter hominis]|uniref:LytR/AlgR family response regulator transcription factor n=1 Tax=Anaerolentibacter hominis TaxID=3079009 RepID=UPI0031B810F0
MRLAICEDNIEELNLVLSQLFRYTELHPEWDVSIHPFSSPKALLAAAKDGQFDLFLLDILMPETNGIELGRQLHEIRPAAVLIYLTSSPEFALEAFRVSAFQYLLKPVSDNQLFQVLDQAMIRIQTKLSQNMAVRTKEGLIALPFSTIAYLESRGHVLYFTLQDRRLVTSTHIRTTFEEAAAPLLGDSRFIHPHKSYIVNMAFVHKLTLKEFMMSDNTAIPISRKNYSEVKSRYLKFLGML